MIEIYNSIPFPQCHHEEVAKNTVLSNSLWGLFQKKLKSIWNPPCFRFMNEEVYHHIIQLSKISSNPGASSPFWATSQSDQLGLKKCSPSHKKRPLLFLNSRKHMGTSQFQLSVSSTNQGTSNQELKSARAEKQSELRLKCSCPCSFATRWTHHVRLLEKVPIVPWFRAVPCGPLPLVNTCALFRPSDSNGLSWRTSMNLKQVEKNLTISSATNKMSIILGLSHEAFKKFSWNNHLKQGEMNLFLGGDKIHNWLVCLDPNLRSLERFPHSLTSSEAAKLTAPWY